MYAGFKTHFDEYVYAGVVEVSKPEILTRMKGVFSALLILTLGVLVVIPLTSTLIGNEQSSLSHHMSIYMVIVIAWILLAVAFGIAYLASEGNKGIKPIPLPVNREEEK